MLLICACFIGMDSITQAALGGLMGELVLGRKLGYKGMLWGILFGTLPDLDVFMAPFLTEAEEMRNHRGLSHSLLAIVLMPFLFGPLLGKLHSEVHWSRAVWFVFLAWSTHVLIDCFNTYGTQVFEPFSDKRVMFGNMSIVDPLFSLPLVVTLIVARRLHYLAMRRRLWAWCCTGWLVCYAGLSFGVKIWVDRWFEQELVASGVAVEKSMSGPSLGNIFLWRCVAEADGKYYVAYRSIFDGDRPSSMVVLDANQELLNELKGEPHVDSIVWFCQGWHAVIPNGKGTFGIVDMRLGEITTEEYKAPVFSWVVDRETMSGGAFRGLVSPMNALIYQGKRIIGRAPNWASSQWVWLK